MSTSLSTGKNGPAAVSEGASYPHPWRPFLVLGVAIFLTVLDLFVVNVALPAVAADFSGASLASLSWVLTAYAIASAAVLVPAGKLGDLFGRRRLFLLGLLVFVAGPRSPRLRPLFRSWSRREGSRRSGRPL